MYIERSIPELFNWCQNTYDTEIGKITVLIDEYTYEILKQRYAELPSSTPDGDSVIYDIKPYLTEISSDEINEAFLESKYTEFIKDLSNGTSQERIDMVLAELREQFSILSVEDQRTADCILEDILSGNLVVDNEKPLSFREYLNQYNQETLSNRIKKLAECFGFREDLLRKIMSYHLKEDDLDRYNRFGKILETMDFNKAKLSLETIEGNEVQDFRVKNRVSKLLKDFILKGGFDPLTYKFA